MFHQDHRSQIPVPVGREPAAADQIWPADQKGMVAGQSNQRTGTGLLTVCFSNCYRRIVRLEKLRSRTIHQINDEAPPVDARNTASIGKAVTGIQLVRRGAERHGTRQGVVFILVEHAVAEVAVAIGGKPSNDRKGMVAAVDSGYAEYVGARECRSQKGARILLIDVSAGLGTCIRLQE